MGTIASLTTTANQITKLLELAVEPLNEKLKELKQKIVFKQVIRGRQLVTVPFITHGFWYYEISLSDEDLPKLLTMNADDIVKYLKS